MIRSLVVLSNWLQSMSYESIFHCQEKEEIKSKMNCLLFLVLVSTSIAKATELAKDMTEPEEDIAFGEVGTSDSTSFVAEADNSAASLCSINTDALNVQISNVIDLKFQNQPGILLIGIIIIVTYFCVLVSVLLNLWTDERRQLNIQKLHGGTLQSKEKILETMVLGDGATAKTGTLLAYRPRFKAYHKTGIGAIFLNLKDLFSCAKSARPVCGRFTQEESGFLKGKALLQATDSGEDFNVFGKNTNTFGMAFQGCPTLDGTNGCLPAKFEVTIVCFLPRSCF